MCQQHPPAPGGRATCTHLAHPNNDTTLPPTPSAAYDPRVAGICLKIEPLAVGWGKLQEIADALAIFKASGKFSIAYIERGGEKEYYLACGCDQVFVPPTGGLALRGVAVAGTFLRGTLDKVGVEPEASGGWVGGWVGRVGGATPSSARLAPTSTDRRQPLSTPSLASL